MNSALREAIDLAAGCKPEFREQTFLRMVQRDSSTVSQGVPAFWFARALEPGQMASMWQPFRESVWVQRAIKTVSGPISAVGLEFYPRQAQAGPAKHSRPRRAIARHSARGVTFRDPGEAIALPQFDQFLRQPARGMSYQSFVEASIGWMKMEECFWLLSDTTLLPFPEARRAAPDPVIIAQPYRMRQVMDKGEVAGWVYSDVMGKQWHLLPQQVIQLKFWNPYDPFRGAGEYQSAKVAAESDWLAAKFSRNLSANNGDTGPYIISKTGVPTNDQREQIIASLREKRHAQLRGDFKAMFLTGDIEIKEPEIQSVDAAFVQQRIENRHEIAAAFGIPMSMFDIKASYSIGSASDAYQLISNTCIPNGAAFCGALAELAWKLWGIDIEVLQDWDEHPVMQQVRRERIAALNDLWSKGMPFKDASDYLDLRAPEFPGNDIGYLPVAVTPAATSMEEAQDDAPTAADYAETPEDPEDDPASIPEPVNQALRALRGESCELHHGAHLIRAPKNHALWQAHMRRRLKGVKLLTSKASKVINQFRAIALRHAAAASAKSVPRHPSPLTRSLVDILFNQESFGAALVSEFKKPTDSLLDAFSTDLLQEVGLADNPWTMPWQAKSEFIASRGETLDGVKKTIWDQIKTVVEDCNEKGAGVDDLTDAIRAKFNDLSKFEARRIAMTETAAIDGFARHATMKGVGLEYKSWLSSHGENVRPAHASAEIRYEADPIPVDEPFIVMGERLQYPGDDAGSAGNVINCQCIVLSAQRKKGKSE